MRNDELFGQVEALMREFFDEYGGPISRDTTARDIPGWDSLANVQLMVLMEQTFGLRFATEEITRLERFGDLVDLIAARKDRAA
jgi:acyl carrier protein